MCTLQSVPPSQLYIQINKPALALTRPPYPPQQDFAPRPGVGNSSISTCFWRFHRWPKRQTAVFSDFQGASSAKICWASSCSISSRSTSTTAMSHEPWEIAIFLWCLESWRQLLSGLCWNPAGQFQQLYSRLGLTFIMDQTAVNRDALFLLLQYMDCMHCSGAGNW